MINFFHARIKRGQHILLFYFAKSTSIHFCSPCLILKTCQSRKRGFDYLKHLVGKKCLHPEVIFFSYLMYFQYFIVFAVAVDFTKEFCLIDRLLVFDI